MTHTSTDQPRETCSACNGTGSGKDGWDCLSCDGDGWTWVFAAPEKAGAAPEGKEQPDALLKLAHYNDDHMTREEIDVLRGADLEIRLLRARVQELEAERASIIAEKDEHKVWLRAARAELEAAQARVPLSDEFMRDLIIFTALGYGVDLEDAEANVAQIMKAARQLKSHPSGITQEKQG